MIDKTDILRKLKAVHDEPICNVERRLAKLLAVVDRLVGEACEPHDKK